MELPFECCPCFVHVCPDSTRWVDTTDLIVFGILFSTITFCDQDFISLDPWTSSKNQSFFFEVS